MTPTAICAASDMDFTGQTAIVTGATRGIGKAITLALLARGATVYAVYGQDQQAAAALASQGQEYTSRLRLRQCNIASAGQVREFYAEIEGSGEALTILVNNAGIRKDAILAMMAAEQWHQVIDTNLHGTYLMSKPAVLLMLPHKYGRIITITSPAAYLGFAGQTNYGAAKAGQIGFTKSLAKETARKGITVNCVAPGFIDTGFLDGLSEDLRREYKSMVPMRRFGQPQDVAEAVLFLASRKAAYITGATLEVTGGL